MLLFQILIFFLILLSFSTVVAGFGRILSSKTSRNFFQDVFLGFILISFTITIIHFFFQNKFTYKFFNFYFWCS